jgi:class 3 adenylate cyclase
VQAVVGEATLALLGQTGAVGDAGSFALPAGTVTFLLTDVEGSTTLW